MKFLNYEERWFWKSTYVAAIRSGSTPSDARYAADEAVNAYRLRVKSE